MVVCSSRRIEPGADGQKGIPSRIWTSMLLSMAALPGDKL
jgi:hypothetical protein